MTAFGKDYAFAYDVLYQDKNYEKESDFIETVFPKYSGNVKRVLDLGCGTGGHAIILDKRDTGFLTVLNTSFKRE